MEIWNSKSGHNMYSEFEVKFGMPFLGMLYIISKLGK